MVQSLNLRLSPDVAYNPLRLKVEVSTVLSIDVNRIVKVDIVKRSIDARQRKVMVNLSISVHIDRLEPDADIAHPVVYAKVADNAPQAIVVGAGPAGLFAALKLIELGVRPIVLERGKCVEERRKDMALISRQGIVNEDSNYCFGEGGAGAFSDGKLYTRSKKRGPVDKILNIFHQHGASRDILVDAHPHIGTDKLPVVISAMRKTILDCGGDVVFNCRVAELLTDGDSVVGVRTAGERVYKGPVILATGHSARDVYQSLFDAGIELEAKGIAVGVRLEHPQDLIDRIQYHSPAGRGKYLPPAEYSMLTRVDGRAVYSFCMCPGGFIIPAASAPGQIVVNGMSPSNRGTKWANSGMVVEILPEDVKGDHPLRMMWYQQQIETSFFDESDGSQNVAAQRMTDFVNGRLSESLVPSSYAPGVHSARLDLLLPVEVASRLQKGFVEFGKKSKGFLTDKAMLVGDETRTSSPVRIPRDNVSLQHLRVKGLFPCGEGAGYAGGIVSAAIDGDRCASALFQYLGLDKIN